MAKKAKKMVKLTFPRNLIKKPVIFTMAKKYDVMPNIRRARVTDDIGEMVLEIEGEEKNIEAGVRFLVRTGVLVEPIVGDIIE